MRINFLGLQWPGTIGMSSDFTERIHRSQWAFRFGLRGGRVRFLAICFIHARSGEDVIATMQTRQFLGTAPTPLPRMFHHPALQKRPPVMTAVREMIHLSRNETTSREAYQPRRNSSMTSHTHARSTRTAIS